MTTPTSVKRAVDSSGDNIATLSTAAGHAQVTSGVPLVVLFDDSADPVCYVGQAEPGTLTSAAAWRIKRVNLASGAITTWADGNANFDNVWNNRSSLTYS